MHRFRLGFSVILISFLICPDLGTASFTLSPLSLHKAVENITTPKALAHFMHRSFEFVQDAHLFGTNDYWQSPEEFWERRAGDCEDYALFAKQALANIGIEAYVVSFYAGNGYGHTIALYKENGLFNIIDEARLREASAKTIEEAISIVNADWTWGALAERRGSRGWMIREIHNNIKST
ncbi:MAG: transglutaminase-like domain-containing protein [Candidatus Omnitrophota bacterium]|nr:transglutaminase-like domain-containing protein [Candidatus Omnitrophota bacterium]